MSAFLVISLLLLKKSEFGKKRTISLTSYPPENLDVLDIDYLYDGKLDSYSVELLIISLANKGYLKIKENSTGIFKIIKVREYDGTNENEKMNMEINDFKVELDRFSEIISESDSFREAIKIYDIKTREKMEIDSKISEMNGKLAQISNTQALKSDIDILYTQLYKEFEEAVLIINNYKEFVYNIVKEQI